MRALPDEITSQSPHLLIQSFGVSFFYHVNLGGKHVVCNTDSAQTQKVPPTSEQVQSDADDTPTLPVLSLEAVETRVLIKIFLTVSLRKIWRLTFDQIQCY